jgi:hypothetical protein
MVERPEFRSIVQREVHRCDVVSNDGNAAEWHRSIGRKRQRPRCGRAMKVKCASRPPRLQRGDERRGGDEFKERATSHGVYSTPFSAPIIGEPIRDAIGDRQEDEHRDPERHGQGIADQSHG